MITINWDSFEAVAWSLSFGYKEYLQKHRERKIKTPTVSKLEYQRIYKQCNQALENDSLTVDVLPEKIFNNEG